MDWQRLDRKATEELIEKAGSASVLFSPSTSEARRASLPFFDKFAMYRLTNYAALPLISLDYLVNEQSEDNNGILYLDGSTAPIMLAARSDTLQLSVDNVIAYTNFYYKNAPDPEGDIYVIDDLESLVFFDLLNPEQQALVQKNFNAPQVIEEHDCFIITGCMVHKGSLVTAKVTVSKDGNIVISDLAMMIRSTPAYHKVED